MNLCNVEQCDSCMACKNICPFDAIEIKVNAFGAIQPAIIQDKCKECGLCQAECPIYKITGNDCTVISILAP